jgi:hypothetical protein
MSQDITAHIVGLTGIKRREASSMNYSLSLVTSENNPYTNEQW